MHTRGAERGIGNATKEVADHARALIGLELELAKLELRRKVAALGIGLGLALGAAVLGLFGLGFGLATVAAALALALPTWAALLIVAGSLFLLAGLLGVIGARLVGRGAPPVPEQAIAEAKLTGEVIRRNGR